jgi:hypothetical protein
MKTEWEKIPDHFEIAKSQDFRCKYCNADLLATHEAFVSSEWDHFYPRSRGGTDKDLVLTCHLCNRVKGRDIFATLEEAKVELKKRRDEYYQKWEYDKLVSDFRPKSAQPKN